MKRKILVGAGLICFAVCVFLMWIRVQYSVNLGDEASYVATSYRILRGDVPYAEIWEPQQNVPLLTSPILWLYTKVTGGWDGSLLFMRRAYVVVALMFAFCEYILLKNRGRWLAFCMVTPLIFFVPFSIPYITYNSLSIAIFFLGLTFMFSIDSKEPEPHARIKIVICGLLYAFNCFVHPGFLFMALMYTLVIGYTAKLYRPDFVKKGVLCYIGAGVAGAVVILCPIVLSIGVKDIMVGIQGMLESPYFAIADRMPGLSEQIRAAFINFFSVSYLRRGTIVFFAMYTSISLLCRKHEKIAGWRFVAVLTGLCFAVLTMLKMPQYTYRIHAYFCVMAMIIWLWIDDKQLKQRTLVQIILPVIMLILIRSSTTANSDMLYQFSAAAILVYVIVLGCTSENDKKEDPAAGVLSIYVFVCICALMTFYRYVFGDESIGKLTARVETGMFQGIYTTEERREGLARLEKDIRENVAADEKMAVITAFPSVYVTANAEVCSPTVYNPMFTGYGYYDAEPVTAYFEMLNTEPDVIAIVLGRSTVPEYDDNAPKYELNQYLHDNYELSFASNEKQTYRVVLYRKKNF